MGDIIEDDRVRLNTETHGRLRQPCRGSQVAYFLWPVHPRLRPACQNSSFSLKFVLTLFFSLSSYSPKLSLMVKVGPVKFPKWFYFIKKRNKVLHAAWFKHSHAADITALSHSSVLTWKQHPQTLFTQRNAATEQCWQKGQQSLRHVHIIRGSVILKQHWAWSLLCAS